MSDPSRLTTEADEETVHQQATLITLSSQPTSTRTASEVVLQDYSREQQKDHIRAILRTWNQEEIAAFYDAEFRCGPDGVDLYENVADELISSHATSQRRAKIEKSIAPFLPFNHNATALSLEQVENHIRRTSPKLSPNDIYDIYTIQRFINPPYILLSIITNLQKRQANLDKGDMRSRKDVSGKIARSMVYSAVMATEKNTIWKTVGRWSSSSNIYYQIRGLAPKHRNAPIVEQTDDPTPQNKREAYHMFVASELGIKVAVLLEREKNGDKEIEDHFRKFQELKALGQKIEKFASTFRRSAGMMLWPFEISKAMGKKASLESFTNGKVEALYNVLRLKPDFEQSCELSKECEAWIENFLQRGMLPSTILSRLEEFRLKHGIIFPVCHSNYLKGIPHLVEVGVDVEPAQEDPIFRHLYSLEGTDHITVRRGAWERQLSVRNTISELARNREISEELILAILNISGVPNNVQIGVPSEYGRFYGSHEVHELQQDIDARALMLICPIHIEHSSHWVGVVAVIPQQAFIKNVNFYFLDSATGIGDAEEATQVVRDWIRQRHPRASNRIGDLPILDLTGDPDVLTIGQQNIGSNDCGVLVCANLLHIAHHITPVADMNPGLGNRLREKYTRLLLTAAADVQNEGESLFVDQFENETGTSGISNGTMMPPSNFESRAEMGTNVARTSKHPRASSTDKTSKRQRTGTGHHTVTTTSSRSSTAASTASTTSLPPNTVATQPIN